MPWETAEVNRKKDFTSFLTWIQPMKSHRIFVYRGRPNFWLLSVKAFSSLCYLRTCTWLALVANHWNCNFLLIPNKPILEGMMLKLKLQYFGHLMRRVASLEKTLMLGGIGGRRRRGRQRMRWQDGITDLMDVSLSELRVGDGQGGLACFDSWGRKESDTTEQLIWSDLIWSCWKNIWQSVSGQQFTKSFHIHYLIFLLLYVASSKNFVRITQVLLYFRVKLVSWDELTSNFSAGRWAVTRPSNDDILTMTQCMCAVTVFQVPLTQNSQYTRMTHWTPSMQCLTTSLTNYINDSVLRMKVEKWVVLVQEI